MEKIELGENRVSAEDLKEDYKPFDFSSVRIEDSSNLVQAPRSFLGSLKEYQLKGLRWLDNLYEQGINGILADEMGLGKTIQAIALLSHVTEKKGNWGPFLIVAPSSTLFNWINEIEKFCPNMKVLPYWGGLKERKVIRKYFVQQQLGRLESQFHICVTSYNIAVQDDKSFYRLRWQHIILDEAQQIKNINSQRWKTLMSFKSRNKLLLTGTPLQNNMAELWALLHFIMPKLFDSHEQFQEWFSKDIEANSTNKNTLNQSQLNRLHAILKPFMLRRVKKDVEKEIGNKIEYEIKCELTQRQKNLYNSIKNKLSVSDFFQMLESKSKVKNLMNLVMQFRKVCNHPELFERRQKKSSFVFTSTTPSVKNTQPVYGVLRMYSANLKNPIAFQLPRLIFHEVWEPRSHQKRNLLNIHEESRLFKLLGISKDDYRIHFEKDLFICFLTLLHSHKYYSRRCYIDGLREALIGPEGKVDYKFPDLRIGSCFKYHGYKETTINGETFAIPKSLSQFRRSHPYRISKVRCTYQKVLNPPVEFLCSDYNFERLRHILYYNPWNFFILHGNRKDFINYEFLPRSSINYHQLVSVYGRSDFHGKLLEKFDSEYPQTIEIPTFESMISDSAKLRYLDRLLADLKRGGHRVLIFCQMTKMMNLLEEYMTKRSHRFFRLDGNTLIGDRNHMVNEFQSNKDIFAFILSTRAGGLGITLTAADTVIFYDNDWNPTMDAQATDRAHRIGQMNDVSVYRYYLRLTQTHQQEHSRGKDRQTRPTEAECPTDRVLRRGL